MVICRRVELRGEPAGPEVHRPVRRTLLAPGPRPRWLRELMVIALMFAAYKLGRLVAAKHVDSAFDNAYVIWDLERILRLPDELSLQSLMLRNITLTRAANVYYAAVHFPATAAFLIWLYVRRPFDYLWLRRTLALLTATGLLVHLAVPVAPPRMLGRLGFVDTADIYGPAVYGPPGPNSLADQYAAMPSLHIGWAILVAIGVIATTRTRWRWLILAHPVLTALVVVATANHFWLDGMVAAGLLAMALAVVGAVAHWRNRDASPALGEARRRLARWRRAGNGPDGPLPGHGLGLPLLPDRSPPDRSRPRQPDRSPPPDRSLPRQSNRSLVPLPDRSPPLPDRSLPLPDRLPPPARAGAAELPAGAEDLADVAGDRCDG